MVSNKLVSIFYIPYKALMVLMQLGTVCKDFGQPLACGVMTLFFIIG